MQHPRPRDVALPAASPSPEDAFVLLGLDPTADAGLQEHALRFYLERCARALPDGPERRAYGERLHRAWSALSATNVAPAPADRTRSSNPYHVLRVHPLAEQELITALYRVLLRRAAEAEDHAAFQALECAYALVGSTAARARYDAESAAPTAQERPPQRAGLPDMRGTITAMRQRLARRVPALMAGSSAVRPAPRARGMEHTPIPAGEAPEVAHPVGALRVLEGGREVMTLPLQDHASYTIGAGPGASIQLPGAEREHARLTAGQGWVLFQQLSDHALSWVNGARAVRALLGPGDHLDIGPYRCQYVVARYEARGWGA